MEFSNGIDISDEELHSDGIDISDEELHCEHREFNYVEGTPSLHQKVTARVHEFSNLLTYALEEKCEAEYSELKMRDRDRFYGVSKIIVYSYGSEKDAQGFLSVELHCNYFYTGCCIISVIDVNEEQRFSRSFSFFPDLLYDAFQRPALTIDRYISRESLLADADVLLPNDILTLMVDVHFVGDSFETGEFLTGARNNFEGSFELSSDNTMELHLDSPLVNCLSNNSIYFRRILNTPMRERDTKRIFLEQTEFEAFEHIGRILTGNDVRFASVRDIFDLYIEAYIYDIPAVTEACTCFLKLSLLNHTVDELLQVANVYVNEVWNELITNKINSLTELDFDEEIQKISINSACLKLPVYGRLWHYKRNFGLGDILFKNVLKESWNFYEKESFNFYR